MDAGSLAEEPLPETHEAPDVESTLAAIHLGVSNERRDQEMDFGAIVEVASQR